MNFNVTEDPRESLNWRRHRSGCPYYRERWFVHSDPDKGEPMYQVFCMMDTPPETQDEQEKCLASKARCWRTAANAKRSRRSAPDIPVESVSRREPA